MTRSPFSTLLVLALAFALTSCDQGTLAPEIVAPGAFSATVKTAALDVPMAGSATFVRDGEGSEFDGSFRQYVIAETEDGATYSFTVLALRSAEGEEILLGSIAPSTSVESGEFAIESSRNLTAPFGYVALFTDRDGPRASRAIEGSVRVSSADNAITGDFDLAFPNDLQISGSFNARPTLD
ncbi:MAG: hypothetical protein AAGI52_11455 [Bacteroidota bacterium]